MRRRASSACGSDSVTPSARAPWWAAACMRSEPQPQPMSSSRSPARCAACGRSTRACAPARARASPLAREVGTGVDEARSEQHLVEGVRDVVVVADRRAIPALRVAPPRGCGLGRRDGRSPQRAGAGDAQGRGRRVAHARAAPARGRQSAGAGRARAPDRRRHPERPRPMPGRGRAGWARAGSARSLARRVSARQAHRGRLSRRPSVVPEAHLTGNCPNAPASTFMRSRLEATVCPAAAVRPSGRSPSLRRRRRRSSFAVHLAASLPRLYGVW